MPDDLATVVKDKDFLAAQPNDQMAYLASVDPDFAKASPEERGAYLNSVLAPARKARAAKPTQFEKERTPEGSSIWRGAKAVGGDVLGAIHGAGEALLNGPTGMMASAPEQAAQMYLADQQRKESGYTPLYRGAAALGQASGVIDPSAMEEAAKHGDTAAIAGHTVLPMIGAAVGADEALGGKGRAAAGRGLRAIGEGVGSVRGKIGGMLHPEEAAGGLHPIVEAVKHPLEIPGRVAGNLLERVFPEPIEQVARRSKIAPAATLPKLDPFAGATSSAKPIGSVELPPVGSTKLPAAAEPIAKPAGAEPAPTRLPTLFEKGTRPEVLKLPNLIDQAAGVKPLKSDVPLREQLTKQTAEEPAAIDPMKEKYPDPAVRQMVRANGEAIYQAAKDNPGLMKDLHNLTRVDLRQALIKAGEDMGQTTVSNSKFAGEGSIPREEAFNRLLEKGLSPEDIVKLGKSHKLSEKAELMGAPRKSLGQEFEAGETSHEKERNRGILRNPKATLEDRRIAQSRLADMEESGWAPENTTILEAQRRTRERAARIRGSRP